MRKGKLYLTLMAFGFIGLLAFVAGFTYNMVGAAESAPSVQVSQAAPGSAEATPPGATSGNNDVKPLEMFWDTYTLIRQRYRLSDTPTWKDQNLLDAGLDGLLRSLGDPYTRFLNAKAYQEMMESNHGQFQGIGAYLRQTPDGKYVQLAPIGNGPAAHAGLKVGDYLLKIDATDAVGIKIDRAKDLIRGPKGTSVRLTVGRLKDPRKPKAADNPMQTLILTVQRDVIRPDEVKYQAGPPAGHEKDREIGYIQLQQFNEDSENQMDTALAALGQKKVKALILDLRGNPGGLLEVAIGIASRFVDGGPVVYIQELGGSRRVHNADRRQFQRLNRPMVILTNRGSASASEIVSGALHDRGVATLVGDTTFGKGLVQTIIPLDNEGNLGALKITTARYFTPAGTDINHKGIAPDIQVAGHNPDSDPFEITDPNANDPQMDTAVKVLREKLAGVGSTKVAGASAH